MVNRREIVLDYAPRKAFLPFHKRTQRWSCLVAHRRAGKTVAAVNEIIKHAALNTTGTGLYGYVAPYRSQAKSISWDYMKRYARPLLKSVNEAELQVDLINGSRIRLFGADNADAMRGLGFDGVYMDEYGDFRPSVWGNVIRPALSDKQGWAVFGGTPKGKNQFWEVLQTARMNPKQWHHLILKASESKILPEEELEDNRRQLSKDQYEQEYECSFEAAIRGAFYGLEMRLANDEKRIGKVDYDPSLPTYTAWDLGYRDDTAIWWYQVLRNEIHVFDYHAVSGKGIKELAKIVTDKKYHYEKHFLPHDAKAKTLAAEGKSIIEQLGEYLGLQNMAIVPDLSLQDGIQAVRKTLPICWFDEKRCYEGIEALRQYEREYDEDKKAFRPTPKHNWCFTGDTEVLTDQGPKRLDALFAEGRVLTSIGLQKYQFPRITRRNSSLVRVTFTDGYSVRCTPDHKFKAQDGWIEAKKLTKGLQIQSSLKLPLIVENVESLSETADVWCMSVPGVEEFSLANGALVHNCSHPADAMRMLAISWNKHQFSEKKTHNPHTLLVGEENSATLNDMWASRPRQRRQRI